MVCAGAVGHGLCWCSRAWSVLVQIAICCPELRRVSRLGHRSASLLRCHCPDGGSGIGATGSGTGGSGCGTGGSGSGTGGSGSGTGGSGSGTGGNGSSTSDSRTGGSGIIGGGSGTGGSRPAAVT